MKYARRGGVYCICHLDVNSALLKKIDTVLHQPVMKYTGRNSADFLFTWMCLQSRKENEDLLIDAEKLLSVCSIFFFL